MKAANDLLVVGSREVLRAPPPRLQDFHQVPEELEVTQELPNPYESIRDVARAWLERWGEEPGRGTDQRGVRRRRRAR